MELTVQLFDDWKDNSNSLTQTCKALQCRQREGDTVGVL